MVFLTLRKEKQISPHWLPNNFVSERDLPRFDREAQDAKSRNRWFKAKNIRNNMVLHKTKSEIKVDKISKKIAEILNQCKER